MLPPGTDVRAWTRVAAQRWAVSARDQPVTSADAVPGRCNVPDQPELHLGSKLRARGCIPCQPGSILPVGVVFQTLCGKEVVPEKSDFPELGGLALDPICLAGEALWIRKAKLGEVTSTGELKLLKQ